jgi:membrane protease YdiL (CAAX protease family)
MPVMPNTESIPNNLPSLSLQHRAWLAGTVLIAVAVQMSVALSDFEVPGSAELNVVVQDVIIGALALAVILLVAKVDRRAIGITMVDRRTTIVRTAAQLLFLAGIAVLYAVGIVVASRAGHVMIPVRPTSLTEFQNVWIFVILAVAIGPLTEEILFRGMLLSALDRPGWRWISIPGSAAVFSLPHWAPGMNVLRLIGPFVIGLILGWSFLRTRCVLTSFLVHAAFNGGVIVKDLLMHFHPALVRRLLGYE